MSVATHDMAMVSANDRQSADRQESIVIKVLESIWLIMPDDMWLPKRTAMPPTAYRPNPSEWDADLKKRIAP